MVLPGSAGDCGYGAVCFCRRRSGDEAVELAAAGAVWLAPDHVLAGAGGSGVVPDSLRQSWRARGATLQISRSHAGALGTHDAGRTGTFPSRHARTVRLRPAGEREQGVMGRFSLRGSKMGGHRRMKIFAY